MSSGGFEPPTLPLTPISDIECGSALHYSMRTLSTHLDAPLNSWHLCQVGLMVVFCKWVSSKIEKRGTYRQLTKIFGWIRTTESRSAEIASAQPAASGSELHYSTKTFICLPILLMWCWWSFVLQGRGRKKLSKFHASRYNNRVSYGTRRRLPLPPWPLG